MIRHKGIRIFLVCASFFVATDSFAVGIKQSNCSDSQASFFSRFDLMCAHVIFQTGIFNASQGKAQNIGIDGLIGDQFTVSNHNDQNVLLGLGYYVDGMKKEKFNIQYGINAFYFPHTTVQGDVIQENLFTNLSYRYAITNWPIYLAAKSIFNVSNRYDITMDLGVGVNIIQTDYFREKSLDDGVTIPDNAFAGQTNTVFSASVGIGIKFNKVFGQLPIEVGYRYFYLGKGFLVKQSSQFASNLSTGNSYANALVVSTST